MVNHTDGPREMTCVSGLTNRGFNRRRILQSENPGERAHYSIEKAMPGNSYSADKSNYICHAMACRHNSQIDKDIAIREGGVDASSLRQFSNALLAHQANAEALVCSMAEPFAYEKKLAACDGRMYYCDYWDEQRSVAPSADARLAESALGRELIDGEDAVAMAMSDAGAVPVLEVA